MNFENFKFNFTEKFREINILLSEEQIKNFYEYMNLLLDWNQKINLTAITNPIDIIEKHFIDSLTVLKYIKDNDKIIDVGTGAGFPGIPLKIANQSLNITLLDSLNKRIIFLNDVIEKLKLNNIDAIHSRAEDYNIENREVYNIAISRAVANMSTLSEYLLPYVKNEGIAIFMKGQNIKEELEKGKNAIQILGGKIEKVDNFTLGNNNERNIIIVRKVKNTPSKYPRKQGKPAKNPI